MSELLLLNNKKSIHLEAEKHEKNNTPLKRMAIFFRLVTLSLSSFKIQKKKFSNPITTTTTNQTNIK